MSFTGAFEMEKIRFVILFELALSIRLNYIIIRSFGLGKIDSAFVLNRNLYLDSDVNYCTFHGYIDISPNRCDLELSKEENSLMLFG